jgi:transposase
MVGQAMKKAVSIVLTTEERELLDCWSRMGETSPDRALRAAIALFAAEGMDNRHIASRLNISPKTAGRWRRRFAAERLAGLNGEFHRGRGKRSKRELAWRTIAAKVASLPDNGRQWSERALAAAIRGCSYSTVRRACHDHGLSLRRRRSRRSRK